MFAHQAITDIKKFIGSTGANRPVDAFLADMTEKICKAQKFHAGEMSGLLDIFIERPDAHEGMFLDSEYLKLPYDLMWIDCTRDLKYAHPLNEKEGELFPRKLGTLVERQEDKLWRMWCCNFFPELNVWIPEISMSEIFVGGRDVGEHLDLRTNQVTSKEVTTRLYSIAEFDYSRLGPNYQQRLVKNTGASTSLLYTFVKLLNCKNITTETHWPPEALNKKRRKSGKQEMFTYKTLNLYLPGGQVKHSSSGQSGDHNRLHFCRGHFKEYTADAPLFGKITGLWWWPPHVRGQNKDGTVVKDYVAVLLPKEAENAGAPIVDRYERLPELLSQS